MARFHKVQLEIVRPGPPHNQLLSPLTAYMALCGEGSPITFHINLEDHKLISRLQQLRYISPEASGAVAVPSRMREAAVIELAEDVGRVLAEVRTLLAEVCRARCDTGGRENEQPQIVHLRLVLGGSELSLIPFEMALAPPAMPGEGLELCLQLGMPVVPTREIRSSRLAPVSWNRSEPKVLLVAAAPAGLDVPLAAHVHALRAALEPWIRWPKVAERDPGKSIDEARLPYVKDRLRVLSGASIEDIYEICSKESFTHVHVLAHGGPDEIAGEQRFGIILCKKGDPSQFEVVSGKRLGKALQAEGAEGSRRSQPVVVTLATCDSGNQSSVLVPGGSIAHDLHAAGIPWVFASQFPLTKVGSVRMAEVLYPRLLRGDDPRQVIYEVRRQLYMSAQRDHDWASLVIYASLPEDLQDQVTNFFERQARSAIFTGLERADDVNDAPGIDDAQKLTEVREALGQVEAYLKFWEARLSKGSSVSERTQLAECYGMQGSTYKRIAVLWSSRAQQKAAANVADSKPPGSGPTADAEARPAGGTDTATAERTEAEVREIKATPAEEANAKALEYYRKALECYRKAMNQGVLHGNKYHWTATQVLCLAAVLNDPAEPGPYRVAYEIAGQNLKQSSTSEEQAWAHGSLAELEMLSLYHAKDPGLTIEEAGRNLAETVAAHCKAIIALTGADSFPVGSTRRQFERYLKYWRCTDWNGIAEAAVAALRG